MEIKKVSSASLENKTHDFLLMGLVVALGFLFIVFEWSSTETKTYTHPNTEDIFIPEELVPITIQKPLTPPAPAVAAPPRVIAPNIIVTENTVVPDVDIVSSDPGIDETFTTPLSTEPEVIDEPEIFAFPEKAPSYPGGQRAMMEYLSKNIKYPAICIENGIQGRVVIGFVVNKDGKIVDVTVLCGVNERLDAEAIRVVSSMPAWIPGEMQGQKVRTRFQLPVNFVMPR